MRSGLDVGATTGLAVLVAWAWGLMVPETPMPPEVAAAGGAILGPLVEDLRKLRRRVLGRWLDTEDLGPSP